MFVNLFSSVPLFCPIIEMIKQDRLKILISRLAIGILLAGAAYWVCSRFWHLRQVHRESSQFQKKDLTSEFNKAHRRDDHQQTPSTSSFEEAKTYEKPLDECMLEEEDEDFDGEILVDFGSKKGKEPIDDEYSELLDQFDILDSDMDWVGEETEAEITVDLVKSLA